MNKSIKIILMVLVMAFISASAFMLHLFYASKINYIAFGDSLAQGYPYYLENKKLGYTDDIYKQINSSGIMKNRINYHDFGISGYTSSDLYSLVSKEDVQKEISKADIITINVGGNDLLQTLSWHSLDDYEYILAAIDNYTDNLAKIFSKLRTINPNAHVYMASLYNPVTSEYKKVNFNDADYMVKYVNKIIKNTAVPYNVEIIDISNTFKGHEFGTKNSWFYDMLHPTDKGYSEMSRPFINSITEDFSTNNYLKFLIKKITG